VASRAGLGNDPRRRRPAFHLGIGKRCFEHGQCLAVEQGQLLETEPDFILDPTFIDEREVGKQRLGRSCDFAIRQHSARGCGKAESCVLFNDADAVLRSPGDLGVLALRRDAQRGERCSAGPYQFLRRTGTQRIRITAQVRDILLEEVLFFFRRSAPSKVREQPRRVDGDARLLERLFILAQRRIRPGSHRIACGSQPGKESERNHPANKTATDHEGRCSKKNAFPEPLASLPACNSSHHITKARHIQQKTWIRHKECVKIYRL
jgi:hypothetical protein